MNIFTPDVIRARRRAAIGVVLRDVFAAALVLVVVLGGSLLAGVLIQFMKGAL